MYKITSSIKQNKLWPWVVLLTCLSIPIHNDLSSKILVLSFIVAAFGVKKVKFEFSFFAFFCILYFLWNGFQILNSENMAFGIKEFERKSSFLLLPLLWLPMHLQSKPYSLKFLSKYLPLFTGITCLILFCISFHSQPDETSFSRISYHELVSIINANAIYFSCFLIISLYLLLSNSKLYLKPFLYSLMFIHLGFLYLLASKIFWILTLILLLYFTLKTQKKVKQYIIVSIILFFGLGLSQTGKIKDRYKKIIQTPLIIKSSEISPNTVFTGVNFRIFLISEGLNIVTQDLYSMTIGQGLGDTQDILNSRIKSNNLYIGDSESENQGFLNYNFHNQYIQTWTESGLIGLLLLLAIPISLIAFGFRTKNESLIILNLIFLTAFITESYLNRYMGILMFLGFNSIFLSFSFNKESNIKFSKRVFDLLFSSLIIILLLSWLLPILSLILWIDNRQSPIFIQNRMGYKQQLFKCYKLRTMIINKDADKLHAQINDSRITRVGHFYRKFGLDELPQFINVFIGNMSIVGPRPLMISEEEKYNTLIDNFSSRLALKPGITGLSQCLGKKGYVNSIYEIRERYKIDKLYIQKASIILDFKILLSTINNMYLKKL